MALNDLYRDVSQAALDLDKRRLWERFSNFDSFAVRVPDEPWPMLGVILGQAGEEFGLTLFRGQNAWECLSAILDPIGPGDDATEDLDTLGFSMSLLGDLTPDAKAFVREAGHPTGATELVPEFIAKRPGRQPRFPNDAELRTLLWVLRGVVEADRKGRMNPAGPDGEAGTLTLTLTADPSSPAVSVTREPMRGSGGPRIVPLPSERPDLADLPRLDATWLVGLPAMPGGIEDDDRSILLLLMADEASALALEARPILAGQLHEAADALWETLRTGGFSGRGGLPRQIRFSSRRLHDAVAPILESAGVRCTYTPHIPQLAAIVAQLLSDFEAELAPFSADADAPSPMAVPDPDDLAGWKEADRRLARRFADHLYHEDRLRSSRAVKRYFDDDDLEHYLKTQDARGVAQAYITWGILDYRPTRKSKTQAEKMLAKGLPEPEAILLRAMMEAYPTLYRVAAHDAEARTVTLADVLLGGAVTIHDRLMSESIEDEVFVAGRAFPAGSFHFLAMAGPPLGAGMSLEAAEYLLDNGLECTPDGLRRGARLFGWLWKWSDEWERDWQPPRLSNTDGDDLLWHTASFGMADPEVVRRALLQRDDTHYDDKNDEFVWLRDEQTGPGVLGGPVALGRIEFIGDELILSVNSSERFARARKWLTELPGVTFRDVTTRRLDEPDEDRPMDERIAEPESVEITPEMAAEFQEMMDQYYMDWLDKPLPILDGLSPRQACRTADGRQRVALLIRTTPAPMGDPPISIPRQAMFRDLGLKPDPTPDTPAVARAPRRARDAGETPSRDKIGRNDPCPCGSGKKYKKCCGRHP